MTFPLPFIGWIADFDLILGIAVVALAAAAILAVRWFLNTVPCPHCHRAGPVCACTLRRRP